MAMLDTGIDFLRGKLIVATPSIPNDCFFAKSVIYIISHGSEGALGIVINNPINNINSSLILNYLNINSPELKVQMPLYFGGPLEPGKGFILHSNDYERDILLNLNSKISLSSNIQIIRDIALGRGPKNSIFALGYAGWQEGQLEEEIENNNWIIMPFSDDLIFSNDDENKWQNAYEKVGINHLQYSIYAGHA